MKKVAVVSSIGMAWGGSEELWARGVYRLLQMGHEITVVKSRIDESHPAFKSLAKAGARLHALLPDDGRVVRLAKRVCWKIRHKFFREEASDLPFVSNQAVGNFGRLLRRMKPSLVIISQGINFDGLGYAYHCFRQGIPYVVIAQKAVDFYWPSAGERSLMRSVLQRAALCLFVSRHNLRLTEEQFGARLPNAELIANPVNVAAPMPFPSFENGFRLACVGRLMILDKGQDILLRILSQPKWKERPVSVSFIGSGEDEQGLKELAELLNVQCIEFQGQVDDIEKVWLDHHALILPSRSEGLPLAMLEAMAAGRPVIVSRAGGNSELLLESATGFSGEANEEAFDGAMERAWKQRHQWAEMGVRASTYLTEHLPQSPETHFANTIHHLLAKQ